MPRRPAQTSRLPATARAYVNQLTALRTNIPARQYLEILHSAALTGRLARFNHTPDGRLIPSGEFDEIDTSQRIEILNRLINKAIPDAREPDLQTLVAAERDDTVDTSAERVSALSDEQLRALATS